MLIYFRFPTRMLSLLPSIRLLCPFFATLLSLFADEAALYDRQIRLWGVEAQNKMRTSSILLYTLRGIATEIAKNIVLAGVGEIMLLDECNVEEEDLGAGFFFRENEVGQKVSRPALFIIRSFCMAAQSEQCNFVHLLVSS